MKKENQVKTNPNLLIFIVFFLAVIGVVLLRFYQLSVLKKSHNVNLSELTPYWQRSSVQPGQRASIYDANGMPLALNTTSYSIFAVVEGASGQDQVVDKDRTAMVLSEHLPLTHDEVLAYLSQPGAQQVEFGIGGQDISQGTKQAIEREHLPGIHFRSQVTRTYPNECFASHLLGFTELDEAGEMHGVMGIELAYDQVLNPGFNKPIHQGISRGEDIRLTLDGPLQNVLEKLLSDTANQYQPEELGAYLLDLESGRLLAAGQRPSFNLRTLDNIDEEWRNLLVENSFEPGSTIKILTLAAARDQGVDTSRKTFQSGSIDIENRIVNDYNMTGWGEITYDQGLVHSSNVGMVKLLEEMGLDTWIDQLEDFGFGRSTQSGLPNENPGHIDFQDPVTATMSSFGQGLLTTPIQLIQAFSAIGNEGQMVKVQYVDTISGEPGYQFEPQPLTQLFRPETAHHVLQIMQDTVKASGGTASDFNHPYIPIAAKTGTAQIADPEGGGYLRGDYDYYYSVVAFFPADQPRYLIYLNMRQPRQAQGKRGAEILAELFHPFVEYVMIND